MYASLMALAVIMTAAGVGMVVFGIPINAFSLGNTLIVSGTTAICGGLILVGLAAAYRQLRRIANAVTRARPRVPPPLDLADPHAPGSLRTAGPPTARIPLPPREPEGQGGFRAPEPHPSSKAETRPEPRPAYRPEPHGDYPAEPSIESQPRSEYQHERHAEPRPESRYAPREYRLDSRYAPAPARNSPDDYAGERQRARISAPIRSEAGSADTGYPDDRGMRLKLPASIAAVFGPRARPESPENAEPQWTAPSDRPVESSAHSASAPEPVHQDSQPEPPPAPADSTEPVQAAPLESKTEEAEFSTVLKSGVVDGLAYTLYADGSIAAELPEGRRRFASIDELRAHLEQNGG
jgi:hypothetical protein